MRGLLTGKSLITGGCGFIGSNLSRQLGVMGAKHDIVDDMSNGHVEFLGTPVAETIHVMDFVSPTIVSAILGGEYDVVFHLAANPRVPYSVEHPHETHEQNVSKTVRLLEHCARSGTRVVFASSCAVYGNAQEVPTSESCPTSPRSPYALQKLQVEQYLELFWDLYQLHSVSLRFFNVYGPNSLGDSPYTTALGAWLRAIREGHPMRSDGNGTQTRDMVYVSDVSRALILAAQNSHKFMGQKFNVGTGRSVSNREILEKLEMMYPGAKHIDAPERPGDVKHTRASISTIRDILNWDPQVDFWDGMKATADWAMSSDLFMKLKSRV